MRNSATISKTTDATGSISIWSTSSPLTKLSQLDYGQKALVKIQLDHKISTAYKLRTKYCIYQSQNETIELFGENGVSQELVSEGLLQ